ncbi:MAG: hypothetical protein Kow00124_13150 [Anaerolineae bacterium]
MLNLTLRPIQPDDAPALRAGCWPDLTPEDAESRVENLCRWQQRGRGQGVVASVDGQIVGTGQLMLWNGRGEISDLIVAPAWRGRGIGTAIIHHLLAAARDSHLAVVEIGVAEANPRAFALYRRLGFRESRRVMLNLGAGPEPVIYLDYPLVEPHRE